MIGSLELQILGKVANWFLGFVIQAWSSEIAATAVIVEPHVRFWSSLYFYLLLEFEYYFK